MFARCSLAWVLAVGATALCLAAGTAEDKKPDEKKKDEPRTGKVTGVVTAKDDRSIEVKADGEEKARKYHVHAKLPEKLLLAVRQAPIGSRVAVEWTFTNHGPIIDRIEVVGKAKKD